MFRAFPEKSAVRRRPPRSRRLRIRTLPGRPGRCALPANRSSVFPGGPGAASSPRQAAMRRWSSPIPGRSAISCSRCRSAAPSRLRRDAADSPFTSGRTPSSSGFNRTASSCGGSMRRSPRGSSILSPGGGESCGLSCTVLPIGRRGRNTTETRGKTTETPAAYLRPI